MEAHWDVQELRKLKVEILDDIHEMSEDPIPDVESIRRKVEDLFSTLEAEIGEKTRSK